MSKFRLLAASAVCALIIVRPATAQSETAPDAASDGQISDQSSERNDIVVTGTLIRGIAPGGSTVIGLNQDQIAATGATTSNELLAYLPQATNYFNSIAVGGQGIPGGNARNQISRPNLRNLPGGNTASGANTLILMDGHRVVGSGIGMLAVDPEIVPPSLVERVEVITDGGSAIYGSDALGGVINFITRRRFDGFRVEGRYGFADDYTSKNASVTAGKAWDSGSAFVGYTYAAHSPLSGIDRDYIKQIDWATGIPTGRFCDVSNITRGGVRYLGTNLNTPIPASGEAACDVTDYRRLVPALKSHNALAGLTQEMAPGVELDVRAFYQWRRDFGNTGPLTSNSVVIPATNYYRTLTGTPANQVQNARFSYGPVLGNEAGKAITTVSSWGITPMLKWDLTDSWQVNLMGNYGESTSSYANTEINTTLQAAALAGTTAQTAINPYNIAATQNLGLISDIGSFINRGEGRNKFLNFRAVADGALLALPGGELHAAVGAEYMSTRYSQRLTNATTRRLTAWSEYEQKVHSLFAELAVPIFGEGNRTGGIHELLLNASARYDKYNDFGDTFNPRVGVTWRPVDWIALRGSWGKSFNAPTPPDQLSALTPLIRILQTPTVPVGFQLPPGNPVSLTISGGGPGLQPQKADTWSVGINVKPPFLEGLTLDVSYYSIDLRGFIVSPNSQATGGTPAFFANFPQYYKLYPDITAADIAAFFALNPDLGPALSAQLAASGEAVASITDNRSRNLGNAQIAGIDFNATYVAQTGFGSIDAMVGGNYMTKSKSQPGGAGGITIDELDINTRLRLAATVGANIGALRAQATLNHLGGFDLAPSSPAYNQTEIPAFNTVNLFFRYDLSEVVSQGTSISLTVNNVFDTNPPEFRDPTQFSFGFTNGRTIGRFVQLGFTQNF